MKRFVCTLFLFYVAHICATPSIFFGPNQNLAQKLCAYLKKARTRVWIASYTLTGKMIPAELIAAHTRGVEVHVLTDQTALENVRSRQAIAKLKRARIPLFIFGRTRHHGLMHHKFAVIDNMVWTGSMNWTTAGSMHNEENAIVLGKKAIVNMYAQHFATLKRRVHHLAHRTPHTTPQIFFIPDHKKLLHKTLLHDLAHAQTRIAVATFELTSKALCEALVAAHKRGVKVTVVFDGQRWKKNQHSKISTLQSAGAATLHSYERSALMHHKLAVIDDVVWTGSMNWTRSGMQRNQENVIRIHDVQLAEKCVAHLKELRKKCQHVGAQQQSKEGLDEYRLKGRHDADYAGYKRACARHWSVGTLR